VCYTKRVKYLQNKKECGDRVHAEGCGLHWHVKGTNGDGDNDQHKKIRVGPEQEKVVK